MVILNKKLRNVLNFININLKHNKKHITLPTIKKRHLKMLIEQNIVVSCYKKKLTLNYIKNTKALPNLLQNLK